MKTLLVVDIDNTVAENAQREHLLPDWTAFFRACDTDTPITPIIEALKPAFERNDVDVIFVTGRNADDEVVRKTQTWLDGHLPTRPVFYRPVGNYSKAAIYKTGVVEQYKTDEHTTIVIVDDDEHICQHFQNLGHTAIQIHKERYDDNARAIGEIVGAPLDDAFFDNLAQKTAEIVAQLTGDDFHEQQLSLFVLVDALNKADGTRAQALLNDNPIDRSKLLVRAADTGSTTAIDHLMAGGVPEEWVKSAILGSLDRPHAATTIAQLLNAQPLSQEMSGDILNSMAKLAAIKPSTIDLVDVFSQFCSVQTIDQVIEDEQQFLHMDPMVRLLQLRQERSDRAALEANVGKDGVERGKEFKL